MKTGRTKGFSLVEVIVALVISASMGTAIFVTFSQGLRLWERSVKVHTGWKTVLVLEKMEEELRNAFRDPRWNFRGTRSELNFSAITHQDESSGGQVFEDAQRYFRYVFDPKDKAVSLQKFGFKDIFAPQIPHRPLTAVLDGINKFELEYYTYDPKSKKYYWKSAWDEPCFPETIKVTVEPDGEGRRKVTRMINMPAGNVCPV